MKSIKAIAIGSLFIIILGLVVQLAYIFLAVGYNDLAKSYPFLNEIRCLFPNFNRYSCYLFTYVYWWLYHRGYS